MNTRTSPPALPELHLSQQQLDAIAGGECTPSEIQVILGDLKKSYEELIDFTAYVIERVAG